MKKLLGVGLVAALAAVALTGCSGAGNASASCQNTIVNKDAKQVTMWAWYPKFKPVVDLFNKSHKDVQICWTNAGAGADGYHKGTSDFTETSHDYVDGPAVGLYGVIKASQAKLEYEAHDLVPDGSDPVFDSFTLTK